MKKVLSLLLALVTLLGSVCALASCGAPKDEGAEISVYLGDTVYDFDPTDYYVDSNAEQLMSLLYEPLFSLDKNGNLKKAAAKSYTVDEDERTISITIRETYWSDGVRVMAEDFLYAWRNNLLEPTKANPAAALLYDIENALEIKQGVVSNSELGVQASLYDLTITYREGADYKQLLKNLASVACSPIRQSAAFTAPTYWSKLANTILTNGPFTVSTLDYGDGTLTLERNVGYHQPTDTVDYDNNVIPFRLVSFFTIDGYKVDCSYEDIEDKTVFYMGDLSLADRKEHESDIVTCDALSTYAYVFNTENPLFAIKEVRKALSIAIDRAAIVEEITLADAASAFLTPAASKGIEQALIAAEAKLTEAKALVESVNLTGIDKTFSLTVNNDEQSRKIAEMVKSAWSELGFTVNIEYATYVKSSQMDFATSTPIEFYDSEIQYLVKEASYGNRDFDVIAVDWQLYSTDPIVALSAFTSKMNGNGESFVDAVTTYRTNISGWTNEQYDAYITAAYNAEDENTRNENLKLAEALLVEEAPIVPIIFNKTAYAASEELRNIKVDGYGHVVLTQVSQKNYESYLPDEED